MNINHTAIGTFTVAVLIGGYVTYEIVAPVDYLNENDQQAVEYIMKLACPELIPKIKTYEGRMEMDSTLEMTKKCNSQVSMQPEYVKSLEFEQALIEEFSRHYE